MDLGSRRHRLNADESPFVYRLVRDRLQQLVMDHNKGEQICPPLTSPSIDGEVDALQFGHDAPIDETEGALYGEVAALFRLLWRMDHNRSGAPEYPELTWSTLESYLTGNTMLPVGNGPLEEAGA